MADLSTITRILAEDWARSLLSARLGASCGADELADIPARDFATIARMLGDGAQRDLLATLGESHLRARPFVSDWPALIRWRDRVLATPRRHPPDLVAAALEALALECHLSGHPELAERAVEQAERIVLEHAQRMAPREPRHHQERTAL